MKKILKLLIITILIAYPCFKARADTMTEGLIKEQLNYYELDKYDKAVKSAVGEIESMEGESFSDIVFGALNGTLDLSFTQVLKLLAGRLFKEVYENIEIMRNIIIIVIFGAALKSLSSSFGESPVGEIGFYIIYIALVSLLITSFVSASQIAALSISKMAAFMHALLPLIVALLAASGRYAVSFVFPPAAMGVIQIATFLINNVIMNIIIFVASVHMVNFMLPTGALNQMAELAGKTIGKGLKWVAAIFMSVISIQTAAAPIAGGIVGKGAKLMVSSVPVVGQVFAGAVDSVFYWGNAVKNGVAVASIVFVAFICIVPILKLAAIAFIYKLTAALIQPVADERIVECIDAAGNYVALFIVAVMCVCVMFVVLLMMVMAAAIG